MTAPLVIDVVSDVVVVVGTGFSTTVVHEVRRRAAAMSGMRMISFFIVGVVPSRTNRRRFLSQMYFGRRFLPWWIVRSGARCYWSRRKPPILKHRAAERSIHLTRRDPNVIFSFSNGAASIPGLAPSRPGDGAIAVDGFFPGARFPNAVEPGGVAPALRPNARARAGDCAPANENPGPLR